MTGRHLKPKSAAGDGGLLAQEPATARFPVSPSLFVRTIAAWLGQTHIVSQGSHREFAELYESFLDAVYESTSSPSTGNGRWRLIRSIAAELRTREAKMVLDCAAGTGFPALDLASAATASDFTIHCTDSDREMLTVLAARARRMELDIDRFAPDRAVTSRGSARIEPMVLDWEDLDTVRAVYDYVMCRGNSLAYANTWDGRREVTSTESIRRYLEKMAGRVRPGGHLHVDAPWRLGLPRSDYKPVATGAVSIWEQVTTEANHRHWQVDFKLPNNQTLKFERFSTLLTISDVKAILDDLGFEQTEPFSLPGERPGFGVIIARKPCSRRRSTGG